MAISSQTGSLIKGAGAAFTAFLFAKGAGSQISRMKWALATAAGGIVYALAEESRKVHAAAEYAANPNAPAPTSGLGPARRMRWKV